MPDPLTFGINKESARATSNPDDLLSATAGIAPAGTSTIDKIWGGQPSWWQQASAQLAKDEEAFAKGGVRGLLQDVAGTMDLAGGFSDAGLVGSIRAFHGSPHDFSKFDISKIGTGEGAQAYGHGLYFAENPQVAEQYKNTLAGISTQVERDGPDGKFIAMSYDNAAQKPIARAEFDTLKEANEWTKQQEASAPRGRQYEVNINADPEHFLDWDKPLSEQSPKVQEAMQKILPGYEDSEFISSSGEKAVRYLTSNAPRKFGTPGVGGFNPSYASQALREAGIPGVKYLDQGSRGAQSLEEIQKEIASYKQELANPNSIIPRERLENGLATFQKRLENYKPPSSNYVVFDDKLIDIIKKYGIAAVITGGISNFTPTAKPAAKREQ